jgi:hypothetical protein
MSLQNLLNRFTACQFFQNQINRNARASDHWLTHHYGWIGHDQRLLHGKPPRADKLLIAKVLYRARAWIPDSGCVPNSQEGHAQEAGIPVLESRPAGSSFGSD